MHTCDTSCSRSSKPINSELGSKVKQTGRQQFIQEKDKRYWWVWVSEVEYAPLDSVLLGDAVLHTHPLLGTSPPGDAVAGAVQHHVEVHACAAPQIASQQTFTDDNIDI